MTFTLPELPYPPDALTPYMSRETLDLHHGKHHQAYVTKLNELVPGTAFDGLSLEALVRESYGRPGYHPSESLMSGEGGRGSAGDAAILNNAGQHWNHSRFWSWMKPSGGGTIPGELEQRLIADFGGVDAFKVKFVETGMAQFGSGWVWLVEEKGRLQVTKTPNGENPLVREGQDPLLGCDVWEHAYYVDYRNRRPDYIKAFLDHLVDWEAVASQRAA